MMPIMDGRKTLRALKADPSLRSIPVIMMSALTTLDKDELAQCAAFLRKPFAYERLLSLLRQELGGDPRRRRRRSDPPAQPRISSPQAIVAPIPSVLVRQPAVLDGSASHDPDGQIASYSTGRAHRRRRTRAT